MKTVATALFLCLAAACADAQVVVHNVRTWPAPDHTRVVFDVTAPVEHVLFTLSGPDRVVVDMREARLRADASSPEAGDSLLKRIRSASRHGGDLRVVLDLKKPARPKSFLLKPNRSYGHRLVIDLHASGGEEAGTARGTKTKPAERERLRDVVVAIDPGHGGEDPGARGKGGTLEKNVVLAVARHLKSMIDRERGMQATLVRDGDYYVGLRRRMEIARRERADLFISIHADAFRDPRVYGSSVYVLSRNGASSEAAKWVAERENSADLIGGVSLDDKDDLLASVLLDLSQTATLSASVDVGGRVLSQLEQLGKTHKRRVQRAGFAVLKSPDIPSILVETAFISNPDEEKKLRDVKHQRRLAKSILHGVREYFRQGAPPGTLLAARKHVIGEGDTLARIADRYRVPLDSLRQANGLSGDHLSVGKVLEIPASHGT